MALSDLASVEDKVAYWAESLATTSSPSETDTESVTSSPSTEATTVPPSESDDDIPELEPLPVPPPEENLWANYVEPTPYQEFIQRFDEDYPQRPPRSDEEDQDSTESFDDHEFLQQFAELYPQNIPWYIDEGLPPYTQGWSSRELAEYCALHSRGLFPHQLAEEEERGSWTNLIEAIIEAQRSPDTEVRVVQSVERGVQTDLIAAYTTENLDLLTSDLPSDFFRPLTPKTPDETYPDSPAADDFRSPELH